MRSRRNCIPCIEKQLANEVDGSPGLRDVDPGPMFRKILDSTIGRMTPVQISQELHEALVGLGGDKDPYQGKKASSNRSAISLLPSIEARLASSHHRVRTAAIASAAGNVMDYGAKNLFDLEKVLDDALRTGLAMDMIDEMEKDLEGAGHLHIIADNSGESVMDGILVREVLKAYPHVHVSYWVKRSPILNDVTRSDALEAGIVEGERVRIVEIAQDGWISHEEVASMEGVILSKGQGNFETLSEKEGIYFSLAVKCEVVAEEIGARIGDLVFFKRGPAVGTTSSQ